MTAAQAAAPAATAPLTALPNLRIHWRRAVRRDPRLSWAEVMVLLEVEDHANLDGTHAHPGRDRLAERTVDHGRARAPYTVRTVTNALRTGRELGYLIRTAESRILHDGSRTADEYRIAIPAEVFDLAEVPAGPVVDEPAPTDQSDTKQPLGGNEPDLGGNPGFPPPDPFSPDSKKTSEKTSVAAGAATTFTRPKDSHEQRWRDGEYTPGARMLHPEWQPNNANRAVAAKLGLDVELLARVFREQMTANRQRRKTWGSTFSAFLREYADNYRSQTTFGFIDHDAVDQAVGEAVDDALTAYAEQYRADKAAEAADQGAPPPFIVTAGMAEKIRKAEKMTGQPFSDTEHAFVLSMLEADPAVFYPVLAGEVERLRDTARVCGKAA